MGNAAPTATDDAFAEFDGIETLGYRVLGVQPNSPASKSGLVSFLDFLVGANGQMLLGSGESLDEGEEYDDIDFPVLLQENKGKPIELLVWNIKSQEQRFVDLIPNDDWGGAGLLGVTIRLDNYGGADERLIRVLEVEEDSPASVAGLVPMKDFLLGTTALAFGSTQILASVLENHIDSVVEIYVYNSDSDMVRVVGLMPTFNWGGRGLLGAEVGTGYLHRLPNACRKTIGQSVERKVRWMNKKSQDAAADSEDSTDEHGAAIDETTLEMEPHLEMEVEKDENNQRRKPEDATKQPHELGNSDSFEQGNKQSTEPQQAQPPSQESTPAVSDTNPTSSDTTESASTPGYSETAGSQPVDTLEPVADTPVVTTVSSAENAADLFSGPAPEETSENPETAETNENSSSKASSFLPSPPKMSY